MNAVSKTSYYTQIVTVTEHYLGPAAERFIRRQVEFHLDKEPESISQSDVQKLKANVGVALGLLVNDKTIVDQAVGEISKIK